MVERKRANEASEQAQALRTKLAALEEKVGRVACPFRLAKVAAVEEAARNLSFFCILPLSQLLTHSLSLYRGLFTTTRCRFPTLDTRRHLFPLQLQLHEPPSAS